MKWGDKLFGNNSGQKAKLARVLAKAGANLGGADIDAWLMDYFWPTQASISAPPKFAPALARTRAILVFCPELLPNNLSPHFKINP